MSSIPKQTFCGGDGFYPSFLSTSQNGCTEACEHFNLARLAVEGFSLNELEKPEAFAGFVLTCEMFLGQKGDTFANRLDCVLLFSNLFTSFLKEDELNYLKKNPDFSEVKLGKRFIYLMDKLVKPHLTSLNMDKPMSEVDPNPDIQAKRVLYARFAEQFILTLWNDFVFTDGKQNTNYWILVNKINLYYLGVDWYDFYFKKPSGEDGKTEHDNSPLFYFFTRMKTILEDKELWESKRMNKIITFFCSGMYNRRRVFDDFPSLDFQKTLLIVYILCKLRFREEFDGIFKFSKSKVIEKFLDKKYNMTKIVMVNDKIVMPNPLCHQTLLLMATEIEKANLE